MTDLEQSPRLQRISRNAAGFFVGGILGLIAIVVVWRGLASSDAIPPLTQADWDQAHRTWNAANVRDYDVEIVVTGKQAATYAVQVREGEVSSAKRNGELLPQHRTWATWTVNGMFETMARDLESVDRHATGRAQPNTPQLQLRAAFDSETGVPQRYLRTEMVKYGTNPEVSWRVTKFERH